MPAKIETKYVDAYPTFHSLVGIHISEDKQDPYPLDFGNYCGIGRWYCCNMWSENLMEWSRRMGKQKWPGGSRIEVKVVDDQFAFICDPRIPKEWLNKKLCITGCGGAKAQTYRAILDLNGEPHSHLVCGCEADDQDVRITGHGTAAEDGSWVMTKQCRHCGRSWPGEW